MSIRRSIMFSLFLHAALIGAIFSVNYRERACPLSSDYMLVSLIEEMTAMTSIASSPIFPHQLAKVYKKGIALPEPASNNTKLFANTQTARDDAKLRNLSASENTKVDTAILVNHHVGFSEETNMSHSNTKENKSDSPSSPENTPTSSFSKRGQRGIEKGGIGGLPEQKTASQNTDKNQPGDEISGSTKRGVSKNNKGIYSLIRTAIENAKSYPLLARKRGMEGTVLISFKIDRKGFPQDIKIVKSSGYQILDEEVPKMLRKASPLPELSGEIVIPITFRLMEYIPDR